MQKNAAEKNFFCLKNNIVIICRGRLIGNRSLQNFSVRLQYAFSRTGYVDDDCLCVLEVEHHQLEACRAVVYAAELR